MESINSMRDLLTKIELLYSDKYSNDIVSLHNKMNELHSKMTQKIVVNTFDSFFEYLSNNSNGNECYISAKQLYNEYTNKFGAMDYREFNKLMKDKYTTAHINSGLAYYVPYRDKISEFVNGFIGKYKYVDMKFSKLCEMYESMFNEAPNKILLGKSLSNHFNKRKSNGETIYEVMVDK